MKQDEHFLARWSRLKRESAVAPQPVVSAPPRAPVDVSKLPDPACMDIDADFTAFLCEEVEEGLRRAALKKLFHLPQFNVMDGLDVYIDDYSLPDPLDPGMLENLAHAREVLMTEPPAPETATAATAATEAPVDVAERELPPPATEEAAGNG